MNKYLQHCLAFLCVMILLLSSMNYTYVLGAVTTLSPEADTAYDAGLNYRYGTATTAEFGVFMDGALRFNLATINGPVSNATLRLYIDLFTNSMNTNLYKAKDVWDEATEMPTKGDLILEDVAINGSGWLEFDVTSYVNAEASGDGKVSFYLTDGTTTNDSEYVDYITKENVATANHPQLVVTYAPQSPPTVTTQAVTAVTGTSATGHGNITDLGGINPTAHGICWNTSGTPTIADSKTDEGAASATGAFTSSITGLTANTLYYARAYATNSEGTSYGSQVTFITDVIAPTVSTLSPADGATAVGINDNLVITFTEPIYLGSGNIVIKKSSDNSIVESISVLGAKVTGSGTSTITVNPDVTLDETTDYYVQIDGTAFDDAAGNSYSGINDTTSWNFTTEDATAPTVVTLSPADGGTNVGSNDNLILTFSEAVTIGTGDVLIKKTSDNTTVETIAIGSGQVIGGGTTTITINPSVTLEDSTGYYVQISSTALDDVAGNSFSGIISTTDWNFTTGDTSLPSLSSLSPTDGATTVGVDDNLVLTFSEAVVVGTGNISIRKSSDDSLVESIAVTGGQVTGGGTITITVNPSVTLDENTSYYVQIDTTAFDDLSGNSYTGISDKTSWNFTTSDTTAPTVVTLSPTDGGTDVGLNNNLVMTFSEAVTVGTGNITIRKGSDNSIAEAISVVGSQVTGASTTVITINPSITFEETTSYYVQIDGTAFDDLSGNSYVGINDSTSWNFTSGSSVSLSNNANLSSLVISDGTLSPTFDKATMTYAVSVPNATTTVTVTPTVEDTGKATVKVNTNAVVSGSASSSIALNTGDNTVTVVVTAEDGTTLKTYTITVNRATVTVNKPATPVIASAVAGDGRVTIQWNGVEGADSYQIFRSTSSGNYGSFIGTLNHTGVGNTHTYTQTGLTNGTTYYFVVEAVNTAGNSLRSNEVNASPRRSTSNSGSSGNSSTPSTETGVVVIVNGSPATMGQESVTEEGGKKTATIQMSASVVNQKIEDVLAGGSATEENLVQVTSTTQGAKQLKTNLNGEVVKKMADHDFKLSIEVDDVVYVIPAHDVGIESIANTMDVDSDELESIDVEVTIDKVADEPLAQLERFTTSRNVQLIVSPVEFTITAKTRTNAGESKAIVVDQFEDYVKRVLKVPASVEPDRITTGIVYNADGTLSHIPTNIYIRDNIYYASLSSKTNSSYSVVWNDAVVESVENHWAQEEVNDMARRMVIEEVDTFMPDAAITRGDFAKYLTKAIGIYRTGVATDAEFSDVKVTDVYADTLENAEAYGIIHGYLDGTFKPEDLITRQEAMAMYARAMTVIGYDVELSDGIEEYTDVVDISKWSYEELKKVVSSGLFIDTTSTTLNPLETLTYAEAAVAIRELLIESDLINE